ncbi:hypothetical protein CHLNCDRAFT_137372 [Chlorella variabilis]|uniref:Uncharacterized protein n=1 Tax=Chlorella variabilis TaxID=554065 RepID=E1ZMA4_CHLVA|nr:hypothetical protein CHLNCDRAFT_137372 [Chlorella variabilis]EFN52972.1 hypothetical protein CHLNCDRAFT_137372 [Chlorella variabilis]|eukprot:XP_005845074.1 hypothetical protein CHLNCDRAFT_137372 [Chlorella variabilis]
MEAVRREVVGQLEEASERLAEVAHELDVVVVQAARQAGSAEEAEHLKRQAATAIADVARMLRAEGPAAAIAEEIVDDDLSNLEETSRAVMHHEGSGGGGGGGGSPRSDAAAAPASPRSPRPAALPAGARHEGSAERTL